MRHPLTPLLFLHSPTQHVSCQGPRLISDNWQAWRGPAGEKPHRWSSVKKGSDQLFHIIGVKIPLVLETTILFKTFSNFFFFLELAGAERHLLPLWFPLSILAWYIRLAGAIVGKSLTDLIEKTMSSSAWRQSVNILKLQQLRGSPRFTVFQMKTWRSLSEIEKIYIKCKDRSQEIERSVWRGFVPPVACRHTCDRRWHADLQLLTDRAGSEPLKWKSTNTRPPKTSLDVGLRRLAAAAICAPISRVEKPVSPKSRGVTNCITLSPGCFVPLPVWATSLVYAFYSPQFISIRYFWIYFLPLNVKTFPLPAFQKWLHCLGVVPSACDLVSCGHVYRMKEYLNHKIGLLEKMHYLS